MYEPDPDSVEESTDKKAARPWLCLIDDAEKAFSFYQEKCDNIDKLYADLKMKADGATEREFAIFWANLEVLKPSLYSRPPVPVVVPRYKDMKELPRLASQLLERDLATSFDVEDINATMLHIRDDLATNGRGVPWLRYEAKKKGKALDQRIRYEHIDRRDFLHDPARKWEEVEWVARRVWLTVRKGVERFGDAFAQAEFKERKADADGEYTGEKKAPVWEIWHKTQRLVVWVTPGVEDVLDSQEPFLDLEGFFPCPRPAFATLQRNTLFPVPDFLYYRDQVEEINELTARISALSESLRMKGFYAAGAEDVSDAIETAIRQNDNNAILIPVPNMGALGGASLKDAIVWLPVKEVAETVAALVELRKQLIEDVYQITGLSDIMRGETDANETLGAQQMKSQYGSIRIRDRQAELVRVARDMARMAGEIIAENFEPDVMLSMAQMEIPSQADIEGQIAEIQSMAQQALQAPEVQQRIAQNPQAAQQVKQQVEGQIKALQETVTIDQIVALLREQRVRPFVLDIETDSTIQPDEMAEKQARAEFLTALGGTLQQLGAMVQAEPGSAPFAGEILKFAVAPFRAGREMEGAIDDFIEQMKSRAGQPQPNPEAEKAKAEAEAREKEMQLDAQMKEREFAMKERAEQAKAEREERKFALEFELKQMELAAKREELEIKQAAAQIDARSKAVQAEISMNAAEQQADIKARQADQQAQHAEAAFRQKSELASRKAMEQA